MFLGSFEQAGNISLACQAADIHRSTFYQWTEHDEKFSMALKQAGEHATDLMEEEARRRAVDGTLKPVFYKGELIAEEVREYSDLLLIFLLKGAKPEKYRERMDVNHTGSVVKAIDREAYEAV